MSYEGAAPRGAFGDLCDACWEAVQRLMEKILRKVLELEKRL